jgi:hypothetical protein
MKSKRKGVTKVKFKKKEWRLTSQILIAGAVISIILSTVGYLGSDIWLASTQWLLIATVLALFGLYTKMNA